MSFLRRAADAVHLTDVIEIARMRRRSREWTAQDERMRVFYSALLGPGDLCFDVGANFGLRTRVFARLRSRVIAVEPQDACMRFLERTYRGYDNVTLVHKALGSSEGQATMRISNARTLSTLQHGGLDIVRALGISKTVSGNAVIEAALDTAADAITHGATIAGTLRRSGEFPAMVTHMVAVGEASGELDAMLARIADTYDQLVDNSLSRLTALTGPILLLFVASVVVLIILSTVLPLLNLTMAL